MKPMSVLVCGIVISAMAAPAVAQQHPQGWNWRPDRPATLEAWQHGDARNRDFTPPVPRGDLRGDIASNVRARPDAQRDDQSRRR
ncbi:hypothetical protein GXB81_17710 [Paraburkholderia sp. Ac-20336]|uniref:hypothetical protein n=1 Tax=Burkholderiaceae TaxID=119060 RepID=UPI00141E14F4|nr:MULTISPECIES: hypothetical protein [Burkholderiaceae]MBN3804872.1 hypothetical protein [Paraburkholderia sp. Ac-20336]MBN3849035.1 hypothetical protein [Paraburkholderia sp. Ac-20342]NIF52375.1 hypothetical protein [Burkholderia sp. Ax-1724]NIF80303.1 hypothetical protein [Paraburkholderia sp. Cy-641]